MIGTQTVFPYLEFLGRLDKSAVVADALYNPPQSAFLKSAAEQGLLTVNGMGMLSNQANMLTRFFLGTDLGAGGKAEAVRAIETAMEGM